MDLFALLVLGFLIYDITNRGGLFDLFACVLGGTFLYCVVKAIFWLPVCALVDLPPPNEAGASVNTFFGLLAFIPLFLALCIARDKKKNKVNDHKRPC